MPRGVKADPADRFELYIDRSGDCHLWTGGKTRSGYGQISVNGKPMRAHIFAFSQANGPVPEGCEVTHSCGVRACVRKEHLFAKPHRANIADKISHGTTGKKLTPDKVRAIRAAYAAGARQVDLAGQHGVRQTLISEVVNRHIWAHVE